MLAKVSEALSKFLSPITSAAKVTARPFLPDRREKRAPKKEELLKKEATPKSTPHLDHALPQAQPSVSLLDLPLPASSSAFRGLQKLGIQLYAKAGRLQKTAGRFRKGVILDEKAD